MRKKGSGEWEKESGVSGGGVLLRKSKSDVHQVGEYEGEQIFEKRFWGGEGGGGWGVGVVGGGWGRMKPDAED